MMEKIRIFIADDHHLFRAGLAEVLRDQEDLDVVGEAASADQAVERIAALAPDIVLMDIDFGNLRETDGIKASRQIADRHADDVRVIMLTMHDENEMLVQAFEAGARGYLLKDADPRQMMDTIRAVHQGGVILSPGQASSILERFCRLKKWDADELIESLTAREKEILLMVAKGETNNQIAWQLNISEKTVRNRLSEIFSKLHVKNRTQAARFASKLRLSGSSQPPDPSNS